MTTSALRDVLRELGAQDESLVHPTYRHLERRTRLFGLTFLQWGQLAACAALAWLLSRAVPLPEPYDLSLAVTLAGVPGAAVIAFGAGELEIAATIRGLRSWHASRGLYIAGERITGSVQGYELHEHGSAPSTEPGRGALSVSSWEAL